MYPNRAAARPGKGPARQLVGKAFADLQQQQRLGGWCAKVVHEDYASVGEAAPADQRTEIAVFVTVTRAVSRDSLRNARSPGSSVRSAA